MKTELKEPIVIQKVGMAELPITNNFQSQQVVYSTETG